MYELDEGVLHKQQNEFDTWLNMQLVWLSAEASEAAPPTPVVEKFEAVEVGLLFPLFHG